MKQLFMVTALRWEGELVVAAKMGEVDVQPPANGMRWLTPPEEVTLGAVLTRIDEPHSVVVSKTRSGTPGPTLCAVAGSQGRRTLGAIALPTVACSLEDIVTF